MRWRKRLQVHPPINNQPAPVEAVNGGEEERVGEEGVQGKFCCFLSVLYFFQFIHLVVSFFSSSLQECE
jgi:hypothetical protein